MKTGVGKYRGYMKTGVGKCMKTGSRKCMKTCSRTCIETGNRKCIKTGRRKMYGDRWQKCMKTDDRKCMKTGDRKCMKTGDRKCILTAAENVWRLVAENIRLEAENIWRQFGRKMYEERETGKKSDRVEGWQESRKLMQRSYHSLALSHRYNVQFAPCGIQVTGLSSPTKTQWHKPVMIQDSQNRWGASLIPTFLCLDALKQAAINPGNQYELPSSDGDPRRRKYIHTAQETAKV